MGSWMKEIEHLTGGGCEHGGTWQFWWTPTQVGEKKSKTLLCLMWKEVEGRNEMPDYLWLGALSGMPDSTAFGTKDTTKKRPGF